MIASLPMYDRPETAAANDRFWQAIRENLPEGPDTLLRDAPLWDQWLSPDLILSQTCGYPFRARLHDKVTLVGTPDYGLPQCPNGHYNSVLVVRADDPRKTPPEFADTRFAYNEALSQSGWAAPQNYAAKQGFRFINPVQTYGHFNSAKAVAEGHADIAGIDALTWEMLIRYDDFTTALKIIDRTEPTPGLPYITAHNRDPGMVFSAIKTAIESLDALDRKTLCLRGIEAISVNDYFAVPNPPPPTDH